MALDSISVAPSSGNGPAPVVKLTVTAPPILLPASSTPPWFPTSFTAPWKLFGAQASSPGSPRSTNPVAPDTDTALATDVPQTMTLPAFRTVSLPTTVALTSESLAPAGTVRLPLMVPPEMHVLPVGDTVRLRPEPSTVWSQVTVWLTAPVLPL